MTDHRAYSVPVFRSIREIPADFGKTVVAIGNFDGVHRGHREILSSAVDEARRTGARALAITFDPHPEQFLRPEAAPGLLTLMPTRLGLLASTGVDAILVLTFDEAFSKIPAREFVQQFLVDVLHVQSVHEGGNFRFGHRAEAGVEELKAFGAEFGFAVHIHRAVCVHGMDVSSSATRALVAAGDVRRARWMLGRPFTICSTQARGRGVGSRLLVPTINFADYAGLVPAFGVYVTQLVAGARCFQSVTNVGNRPTFDGAGFGIETHILDFEPIDWAEDAQLDLRFFYRLRAEKTWPTPEALREQIFKDVGRAKRYFQLLADGESGA